MVAAPAPVLDLVAEVPVARTITVADLADFVDELAAYHAYYAPYFRPDQRGWAEFYLRGLLTADVPRKNIEAMVLRLLGAGPAADRQVRAAQYFISEGTWDDAPVLDVAAALALVAYQQRHKTAAYRSHRKRRLLALQALGP